MSALSIKNLTKNFGLAEVICGVDLEVEKGEVHAVIGPNGAGKSTFFNLLSGAFAPTGGEIRLNGERIDGLTPEKIQQRGLSRSFQVSNVFVNLSVFEPALRLLQDRRLRLCVLASGQQDQGRQRARRGSAGDDRPAGAA
jgi:ABC-type branched-subunit amino acid transport system ATPase component